MIVLAGPLMCCFVFVILGVSSHAGGRNARFMSPDLSYGYECSYEGAGKLLPVVWGKCNTSRGWDGDNTRA